MEALAQAGDSEPVAPADNRSWAVRRAQEREELRDRIGKIKREPRFTCGSCHRDFSMQQYGGKLQVIGGGTIDECILCHDVPF